MFVYLVQHGEAKPKEQDPHRPLTERGREEVARVARRLASVDTEVRSIRHSGKLRAAETADIFADHLGPAGGVEAMDGLSPLDDPGEVKGVLDDADAALMLVGHLPHLSRLASTLLLGDPEPEPLEFRNGGVVCLESTEEGWKLAWYLTPDLSA